ncbi:unnamed protein product [Symbiodinium microadriaticum]|nr:unnamed protein product [Symbiodinium microadriaticum]
MHTRNKNRAIEVYTRDGNYKSGNDLNGNWGDLYGRHPSHWTCPSIGDIAHGKCRDDFGGWGDRFVQLGDWRMAAIDEDNFAFTHKNGKNVEIFKSDGRRVVGRNSDRVWRRTVSNRETTVQTGDSMVAIDSEVRSCLPIVDISGRRYPMYGSIVQQMIIAQSEMQRFHETEILRHEAIAQALMRRILEMTQEDQGRLYHEN